MLAASAADVAEALAATGRASVEWKLDGARIQVHRAGDEVRVFTRNLNDVTARLPEVVEVVRTLPGADRSCSTARRSASPTTTRPRRFQDTMSRFGADDAVDARADARTRSSSTCCTSTATICSTGRSRERAAMLAELVGAGRVVPSIVTDDADAADAFLADALADRARRRDGEGARLALRRRSPRAPRGARSSRSARSISSCSPPSGATAGGAVGSRTCTSARAIPTPASFVMVGKTFKGLTDELLTWQTERCRSSRRDRRPHRVRAARSWSSRSRSTACRCRRAIPGGVALRFARVRGYRPDKSPADADTIDAVRALLPQSPTCTPDRRGHATPRCPGHTLVTTS